MKVTKKKRPTAYDKGQHKLICNALKVSSDPEAPGCTAYEAVCILLMKLDCAKDFCEDENTEKSLEFLKFLNKGYEDEEFNFLPLYGTEVK